jgi:hypothetical protein
MKMFKSFVLVSKLRFVIACGLRFKTGKSDEGIIAMLILFHGVKKPNQVSK